MIDAWGVERLTMYFLARTLQTLTSGTASYTIGTNGTINIVRPLTIEKAGLIIDTSASPTTEMPIRVFRDEEYTRIVQKSLASSYAQGIWYDHNWSAGLGRIYPWPVPNIGTTQLVIYTPTAIAEFADLSTNYTFPAGYGRALHWNLCIECAPEFAAELTQEIVDNARTSKAWLKRGNTRPRTLKVDAALVKDGGAYDIRTDSPHYR